MKAKLDRRVTLLDPKEETNSIGDRKTKLKEVRKDIAKSKKGLKTPLRNDSAEDRMKENTKRINQLEKKMNGLPKDDPAYTVGDKELKELKADNIKLDDIIKDGKIEFHLVAWNQAAVEKDFTQVEKEADGFQKVLEDKNGHLSNPKTVRT